MALAQMMGLAAALDAEKYLSIAAEPLAYVATATRVFLEPLTSDDWEIVETNAGHLEEEMLSQVSQRCPPPSPPLANPSPTTRVLKNPFPLASVAAAPTESGNVLCAGMTRGVASEFCLRVRVLTAVPSSFQRRHSRGAAFEALCHRDVSLVCCWRECWECDRRGCHRIYTPVFWS